DGDEVARAHPINVCLHLHTVNFGNVELLHVEGRYLIDWANHELIRLHELTDTVIELSALAFVACELRSGDLLTGLSVLDDRVFHQMEMGLQQIPVAQFKSPRTPRLEDIVGITEIRRTIFDATSQRCKDVALRIDGSSHTWVNRQTAKVTIPGN